MICGEEGGFERVSGFLLMVEVEVDGLMGNVIAWYWVGYWKL